MGKNFLTPKQMLKKERNRKICYEFKVLCENNPTDSRNNILASLGEKYDLDRMRIRQILIEGGEYTVKSTKATA